MKKIKISVEILSLILFIVALFPLRSYAAVRQRPVKYKGYVSSLTFTIIKHKKSITKFHKPVINRKILITNALNKIAMAFKKHIPVIKVKSFKPKTVTAYGFAFSSYKINSLLAERLNYVKGLIKDKKVISITGYTDNFGSKAYNNKLALERAKSAEKYLGLKNIKLYGYGKCCYISKINLKDRRIAIKYLP